MARQVSEASQLMWLENEGVLLGRVVPVDKAVKNGRVRYLMAGESYLRWRRTGIQVLAPSYRRLCTMSPENIHGLRAARLTRNERDNWDRLKDWSDWDDDRQRALDAVMVAKTKAERLEAHERLQVYEPDPDWLNQAVADVRHHMHGDFSVGGC